MAEQYSNSAKGTLAVGIDSVATAITLDDTPGAYNFGYVGKGDFKRATITGADPDVYEIVYITASDGVSLDLIVERGKEGTRQLTWGVGSEISCRVTSGMLDNFLQQDKYGVVRSRPGRPSDTFVVNGRLTNFGVMLAGYHVLPLITAQPTTTVGQQDGNMTRESVGGSLFVDLGDSIPTWVANTYYQERSIVRPTTPDGYIYLLETFTGYGAAQSAVEPGWSMGNGVTEATIGGTPSGSWIPLSDPLVVNLTFAGASNKLLLSEVGFICMGYNTVTTPPSVSVGVPGNPTRFANAVSLTGVTAAGKVWRVPVTTDELVSGLVFTLDTAATGSLTGRFYWRGAFIEMPT